MAPPEVLARMARHGVRQRDDGRFVSKLDPFFRQGVSKPITEEDMAQASRDEAGDLWQALEKISCPTLVVRGAASDVLSPDTADRMVDEALQDGTLAIVPQSAHAVMVENPSGFNEAVAAFVLGE
jgi:pimeloyl-ACP methyl ester carboxylesterase